MEYLVVDGVKLGEEDPVDGARAALLRVVHESLVEVQQLIHCLIAHKSLTHKQHQVW